MLTSIQPSSFISRASSLALDPLTAKRLLGGAISSALLMAGLFLSSILGSVVGRGEAEGGVATGIRKRVGGDPRGDPKCSEKGLVERRDVAKRLPRRFLSQERLCERS